MVAPPGSNPARQLSSRWPSTNRESAHITKRCFICNDTERNPRWWSPTPRFGSGSGSSPLNTVQFSLWTGLTWRWKWVKNVVKHLLLQVLCQSLVFWFKSQLGTKNWKEKNGCRRGVGAFSQHCRSTLEQGTVRPGKRTRADTSPSWSHAHICHVSLPLCGNKNLDGPLKCNNYSSVETIHGVGR